MVDKDIVSQAVDNLIEKYGDEDLSPETRYDLLKQEIELVEKGRDEKEDKNEGDLRPDSPPKPDPIDRDFA